MLTSRRLPDQVTVLTPAEGPVSGGHNNPTTTWAPADPVPGLFQQQASTERLQNEDVTVTRGVLFLQPNVPITSSCRVQLASVPGVTWRVAGEPAVFAGRLGHIEAVLEAIQDN